MWKLGAAAAVVFHTPQHVPIHSITAHFIYNIRIYDSEDQKSKSFISGEKVFFRANSNHSSCNICVHFGHFWQYKSSKPPLCCCWVVCKVILSFEFATCQIHFDYKFWTWLLAKLLRLTSDWTKKHPAIIHMFIGICRVIYDRARNRKKYFEIAFFL